MQKLLQSSLFLIALRLQFFALLAVATYLSLASLQGSLVANVWDKALHIVGWAGLYGSLQLACLFRAKVAVAAASLLTYSFFIEIGQYFCGRTFSLLDLLANGCGIGVAILAIVITKRLLQSLGAVWPGNA